MATRYTADRPLPVGIDRSLERAMRDARDELDVISSARPVRPKEGVGFGAPWAWFGSIVMLMHGIELGREPSDLDVFVDPWVWTVLSSRGWAIRLPNPADPPFLSRGIGHIEVCAFYRWTAEDPEVNADHCRITAECMYGHYLAPLEVIRTHKMMAAKWGDDPRREKHAADVRLIDDYLGTVR